MNHMGSNITKYLLVRGMYHTVKHMYHRFAPYNSCPNIILPRHMFWRMIVYATLSA